MKKPYEKPQVKGIDLKLEEKESVCSVYRGLCSVFRASKVEPPAKTEAKKGDYVHYLRKGEYIFYVNLPNMPGQLARLAEALGNRGIQINTVIGVGADTSMIVICTDKKEETRDTLKELGLDFKEEEFLTFHIPNRPSALGNFAKKLGDANINIDTIFVVDKEVELGIAISVKDKDRAKEVLL